jgi:hypothetical protein
MSCHKGALSIAVWQLDEPMTQNDFQGRSKNGATQYRPECPWIVHHLEALPTLLESLVAISNWIFVLGAALEPE